MYFAKYLRAVDKKFFVKSLYFVNTKKCLRTKKVATCVGAKKKLGPYSSIKKPARYRVPLNIRYI